MRELAAALDVSPATVAAAYRTLKQRGFVVADRGRGTSVAAAAARARAAGCRATRRAFATWRAAIPTRCSSPRSRRRSPASSPTHKLYGGATKLPSSPSRAAAEFAADGIHGDVAITGGALDAIERALQTELRPGDRVVVEDPSWPRIADLVHALGLAVEPVAVDWRGLDPDPLDGALRRGARAVIATPRGQNPTGAAVDPARGRRCAQCWPATPTCS